MSESAFENPIIMHVGEQFSGQRLDAALASMLPDYSRSRLQQWIRDGHVLLDGKPVKPRTKLAGDEILELNIQLDNHSEALQPQDIPLDIVFEDEDIIVLNKPAGLVVHPAAGHADGTLVNALLHFDAELACVPRAGIVHRLDKDASGLLLVALSRQSLAELTRQLEAREVSKEYLALVRGHVHGEEGRIDLPLETRKGRSRGRRICGRSHRVPRHGGRPDDSGGGLRHRQWNLETCHRRCRWGSAG